ncbi:carbohydrate ABC transporter permease, partial [Streptomyces sp. 8ZJF_21]|nr:carbohydrate ABC transporter permease [Streptomyces sp. 8ZJF_21]
MTTAPITTTPAARRRPTGRIVLHLCLIAVLLVMLYPLAWLVATSFKPADEVIASLKLLPSHFEWGNYSTA